MNNNNNNNNNRFYYFFFKFVAVYYAILSVKYRAPDIQAYRVLGFLTFDYSSIYFVV